MEVINVGKDWITLAGQVSYEDDKLWQLSAGIRLLHFVSASATYAIQHSRIKAVITTAAARIAPRRLLDLAALNESTVGCVQLEYTELNRTALWATARPRFLTVSLQIELLTDAGFGRHTRGKNT